MRASRLNVLASMWKSGPSGPRLKFNGTEAGPSPTGPKGQITYVHNAAINGRSSTVILFDHEAAKAARVEDPRMPARCDV
jgi:hypothetical protein